MRCDVGEVEKERPSPVPANEVDPPVGEHSVCIPLDRLLLTAEPELRRELLPGVASVRKAKKLVESLIHRVHIIGAPRSRTAMVPLPEQRGRVVARLQRLGQSYLRRGKVVAVARHPIVDAILSRQEGRPARSTDHAGGVPPLEARSLRGQPVEVGCLPFGPAVEAHVAPAQVIRVDDDYIGPLARRGADAREYRGRREAGASEYQRMASDPN